MTPAASHSSRPDRAAGRDVERADVTLRWTFRPRADVLFGYCFPGRFLLDTPGRRPAATYYPDSAYGFDNSPSEAGSPRLWGGRRRDEAVFGDDPSWVIGVGSFQRVEVGRGD